MNAKTLFGGLLIFNIVFILLFISWQSGKNDTAIKIKQEKIANNNIRGQKQQQPELINNQPNHKKITYQDKLYLSKRRQELILNLFKTLNSYPKIDQQYYLGDTTNINKVFTFFNKPYFGLKKEDDYCQRSDSYFLLNRQNYFNQRYIYTNYLSSNLIRTRVINVIGNETEPRSSFDMPRQIKKSYRYPIPLHTQLFFTRTMMHIFLQLGTQFGCFFQMYNIIPGHPRITRKDFVVQTIRQYSQKYVSSPQCFNSETFFPQTYMLENQTECKLFFDEINSPQYKQLQITHPVQYLVKNADGQHRGKAVNLLNDQLEEQLKQKYKNGQQCGGISKNGILIQKYLQNPLLVEGHKFDFRLYLFIASTDPLIVYYHDGFLRVSLQMYDVQSKDKNVHLTNTEFSKKIFENAQKTGKNVEQLKDLQMWNFDKFQQYLLQQGKITDPNWLNNYLRPTFQKAFVHIARMLKPHILKDHRLFNFFGVDFMMDENLNIQFIEANVVPSIKPEQQQKEDFIASMLIDLFKIIFAQMQSRAKRIFILLENAAEEKAKQEFGIEPKTEDESNRRNKLLDINNLSHKFNYYKTNFIDDEFKLKKNNEWVKVLDENLGDTIEASNHLLDQSCFQ